MVGRMKKRQQRRFSTNQFSPELVYETVFERMSRKICEGDVLNDHDFKTIDAVEKMKTWIMDEKKTTKTKYQKT